MTRYSASRGIRYTAPPGPDGDEEEAEDPSVASDGGRADATADD